MFASLSGGSRVSGTGLFLCLGFRVQCIGFRVEGFFRVQSSPLYRVTFGFGKMVCGLWFRIQRVGKGSMVSIVYRVST